MRLLILCFLIYLGYKVIKAMITPGKPRQTPEMGRSVAQVDDIMVQDPVCHTYIPRKDGIAETVGKETFYFCSTACRDKYLDKFGEKPE
jgi:YHS domain-containing protein